MQARYLAAGLIKVLYFARDSKFDILLEGDNLRLQLGGPLVGLCRIQIELDVASSLGGDLGNQLADLLEVGDLIAGNQLAQLLKLGSDRNLLGFRQLVHIRLKSAQFGPGLLEVLHLAGDGERD